MILDTRTFLRRSLIALSCVLNACNPCNNKIVQEQPSPDGKYIATAFVRDCGATTDYSPQVELRKAGSERGTIGNVYIGNHSETIAIAWPSPGELNIRTDAVKVKQLEEYEGIRISIKD